MPIQRIRPFIATVVCFLLFAAYASSGCLALAAKQEPAASRSDRFLRVKAWTGTFTMTTPLQEGRGQDANGNQNTWQLESSSHGTVLIDELVDASDYGCRWEGSGEGNLVVNHRNRWVMKYNRPCILTLTTQGTYPLTVDAKGNSLRSRLFLRRSQDTYDFDFLHSSASVERRQVGTCFKKPVDESRNNAESFFFSARKIPLPTSGLTLSGSQKLKQSKSSLWPLMYTGTQNKVDYDVEIAWNLQPVLDDIELVVDPQGYETWRPEAGLNESTIGNEIKIDATLQRPDGGPANVKARRIIFELIETSREPGVAMNLPIAGAAKDFDLQFSPRSNLRPRYIVSGAGDQRLETLPGEYVDASAVVSSYDWGGWSNLKVTAELQDGRVVMGHLKGKRGVTQILLPKRAKDSRIADIWKENTSAALPDEDDSETGPGGDSSPGDGFSLYEEYRGFYADSRHVSGHPKKIDFFVRNYVGPDARPGIDLFADLTGSEVHATLRDDEFERQKRVMNVNHGKAPHLIDQHGVFLETQPALDGGLTVLSKAGVRGRPVITLSVNLQPRDSLTSMATSENVPVSDLAFAYDRAVAHELMHAVGGEHHGQGDGKATFFFVYGDDPLNATGKPYFRFPLMDGGRSVTIIDEASGRDLASVREGDMMLAREQLRPLFYPQMLTEARKALAARQGYNIPWTAEQLAEHDLDFSVANFLAPTWYVVAEHGECSGNELCVMRYYFARLYEKKGSERAFYFVSDHRSEHAGLDLCRLAVGTGINDRQRQPQPRYGDAAVGRGACSDSIIFNDALPLKPDAVAEGPQQ